MTTPMTPARTLIPELAKMVEEGRLKLQAEYAGGSCVYNIPGLGDMVVDEAGADIWPAGQVEPVPTVSTQSDAAAWIARRINHTPAKAGPVE